MSVNSYVLNRARRFFNTKINTNVIASTRILVMSCLIICNGIDTGFPFLPYGYLHNQLVLIFLIYQAPSIDHISTQSVYGLGV